MWIIMKFACVPILLVALVFAAASDSPAGYDKEDNDAETSEQVSDDVEDGMEEGDLPILPPLILLDFINDTNSSSGDEKTKRTVNDSLGYGFQMNNFFSGKKVNYYFPSGKSGTTVSIEESISPFLPRTIIERSKPVTEKPESDSKMQAKTAEFRSQYYSGIQPLFGQKTKSSGSFDRQRYTTTVKPTIITTTEKPVYATSTPAPLYNGFYSSKSRYQSNPSASESYSTKKSSFIDQTTSAPFIGTTSATNLENNFGRFPSQKIVSSTLNPVVSEQFYQPVTVPPPGSYSSFTRDKLIHPSVLNSYPKYTIENGVKYEHKIIWKYPDGRVSDDPPSSYTNSYSEYSVAPRTSSYTISDATAKVKNRANYNYRTNVNYQGPAQFPKDAENNFQKQNSFVKTAEHNNVQNSKNFQHFYSSPAQKFSVPKLQVGTANPEYLPPVENSSKDSSASQLPGTPLKYNTETQKLITKVLSPPKESFTDDSEYTDYTNNNYAELLNYNPSISQYIKNPASILNAQPTFIQAGNSLIPVIILRVDGTPPVQKKSTPNINLKALLQQYISQYANNVRDLSRGTNFDFEDDELVNRYQDPYYDLKKLTDTLKKLSQQATTSRPNVGESVTDSYGNVLDPELKSFAESRRNSNYRNPYKKQKVMNVQIVEDPRFYDYKEDN